MHTASFAQILDLYLDEVPSDITPIKVTALTPGDYQLYLFAYKQQWFVLVEADYSPLKSLPNDVQANLPVKARHWQVLKQKHAGTDASILPLTCFSSDTANETDDNWRNFACTFHYQHGFYYALLGVSQESIYAN